MQARTAIRLEDESSGEGGYSLGHAYGKQHAAPAKHMLGAGLGGAPS
jgi:hypothetical protein